LGILPFAICKTYAWPFDTQPPVAVLVADPKYVVPGNSVTLDGSGSYDPDGSITKYEWDWTNDGTYDYSESPGDGKATHTYGSQGTYTAKLRVTDNKGATDTDTCNVTVFKIKSQTVATTPADRSRTTIGISEWVTCSTDPSISVEWSVVGGGLVDPYSGTSTTFKASKSPSNPVVHAQKDGADCTLSFTVIAPTGLTFSFYGDVALGTPGPPNNYIGAISQYTCTIQPTTVSFYNANFQENIPLQNYTWPDGTNDSYGPVTCEYGVTQSNQCTESSSSGLDPIGRIYTSGSYVNFEYVINVPEQYKNQNNVWVNWYSTENHDHEYRGSDQKARSEVHGDNTASGGWQGPWQ